MKEEIFIYFIGTAGSGKSTLTDSFKKWMILKGLDAVTVNLDPGADNLPYEPDVDIRDWISLEEVMESYNLGPNGAQIACADMLALNTEDVKKSIESFKADYIFMDTPGQLELFVFREAGKYIIEFFNPNRSLIAYLLDPGCANTASGFVSQLLLSLNTNFRLNKPHLNVLTKVDITEEKTSNQIKRWAESSYELENAIFSEKASVYREISEKILHLISNFQEHASLISVGKEELFGIDDLYTAIQLQFKGGEDLLKD